MPTSLETIAQHNHADVYARIALDTETGALCAILSGPEGGFGVEAEATEATAAEDLPAAIDTMDRRLKAWADAIDALRLAIMRGDVLDHFAAPEA